MMEAGRAAKRGNMQRIMQYMLLFALGCTSDLANGAPVTLQFSRHVSGVSDISFRIGARATCYSTYDPNAPSYEQSASHPILAIAIPEAQFYLEMTSYQLGVQNNILWNEFDPAERESRDEVRITFTHFPALYY